MKVMELDEVTMQVDIAFSEREMQFIRLRFEQEMGYKEIAGYMNISARTCKWYASRLYAKLGFPMYGNNVATIRAVKWLIKNGIIET